MSATTGGGEGGAVAAVAEEAVWYLLRLHDCRRCNSGCLGSPAYKASVAGHLMTGGVGNGIAIRLRPRHLRR